MIGVNSWSPARWRPDEVLGGRAPSIKDLNRLVYTRCVFSEGMRLYPPAWVLERLAVMSQHLVHRDRRWYCEPSGLCPGPVAPWRGRDAA
ncbi:MAG TPA: hypothetical protein VNW46_08845 [Gemmatimonadaceae bacterium]|nr:hypothetical protein [Gemmatimonadaceae bacterium]